MRSSEALICQTSPAANAASCRIHEFLVAEAVRLDGLVSREDAEAHRPGAPRNRHRVGDGACGLGDVHTQAQVRRTSTKHSVTEDHLITS